MKYTKDDLRLRIIDLEMLILQFAARHECASSDWKNQPHVRPLLQEAKNITSQKPDEYYT